MGRPIPKSVSWDVAMTLLRRFYFELDYTLQSIKTFRDKCVCVCVSIDYNKYNNDKDFY